MLRFLWDVFQSTASASILRMLAAPARWRSKEWSELACFAALVGASFAYRQRLESALRVGRRGHALARLVSELGEGRVAVVFVATLLAVGLARSSKRTVEAAIDLAVACTWAYGLMVIGRWVLAEARPREGGAMHWFSHGYGVSGHAALAGALFFTVRDVLARDIPDRQRALLGAALAAWIVLVSWSRVALGMHYAWNVLLGAGIGLFVSREVAAATLFSGENRGPEYS